MTVRQFAVIVVATLTIGGSTLAGQIGGQPQGGGRGRAGGPPPPPANLPESPTAVALPTISAEVTGPGPDLRLVSLARAWKGTGSIQLRGARVLRQRNGQRRALHDAHRRPEASRQLEVQRTRARRSDARQRRRAHVRVHLDLHDGLRSRRGRDPDDATGAVRRAQRSALRRPEAQWRTDERDPRADRIARSQRKRWLADR